MTIRSILLASALVLSAVPASAADGNVVLIDVGKVVVPFKLPGLCRVSGTVDRVWDGKAFRAGQTITLKVPCSAGNSYMTPIDAVQAYPHFISADVLMKSKQGLARLDDSGDLLWQSAGRSYGPWMLVSGYRVLDAISLPVPGHTNS